MPFAGVSESTQAFLGLAAIHHSPRKMTHQRASHGVAPVPTVAGLTHAAAIRLAIFAMVERLQPVACCIVLDDSLAAMLAMLSLRSESSGRPNAPNLELRPSTSHV